MKKVQQNFDSVLKPVPGTERVCLQGHQVDKMLPGAARDGFTVENFSSRLDWAREKKIGMDIPPCFYSHPKPDNGLSLFHPDAGIRSFRMPDGFKDISSGRKMSLTSPHAWQGRRRSPPLPRGSVRNYYCESCGRPGDFEMMQQISSYEEKVLSLRK